MSAGHERTIVEFDHHSPEYAADPFGTIARLRETARLPFSERHGGYWILTKYEDLATVARDDETFSSRHDPPGNDYTGEGPYTGIVLPGSPVVSSFIEMDPPESLEYRKLLNRWF